jgi:hypothetical protein
VPCTFGAFLPSPAVCPGLRVRPLRTMRPPGSGDTPYGADVRVARKGATRSSVPRHAEHSLLRRLGESPGDRPALPIDGSGCSRIGAGVVARAPNDDAERPGALQGGSSPDQGRVASTFSTAPHRPLVELAGRPRCRQPVGPAKTYGGTAQRGRAVSGWRWGSVGLGDSPK